MMMMMIIYSTIQWHLNTVSQFVAANFLSIYWQLIKKYLQQRVFRRKKKVLDLKLQSIFVKFLVIARHHIQK